MFEIWYLWDQDNCPQYRGVCIMKAGIGTGWGRAGGTSTNSYMGRLCPKA